MSCFAQARRRPGFRHLIWIPLLICMLIASELPADTIILRDGERVDGKVIQQGRREIHVRLPDGRVRTIRKSDLKSLRFGPTPAEEAAAREAERKRQAEEERRQREAAEQERREAGRRAAAEARRQFREEQARAEEAERERRAAEQAAEEARRQFEAEQRRAEAARRELAAREAERREQERLARERTQPERESLELGVELRRGRESASLWNAPYREFFTGASVLNSLATGLPFAELFSPLDQTQTGGLGLSARYRRDRWSGLVELESDSGDFERNYVRAVQTASSSAGRLGRFDAEWDRQESRLGGGYQFLEFDNTTLEALLGLHGAAESVQYRGFFGARNAVSTPFGVIFADGLGQAGVWEDSLEEGGGHLGLRLTYLLHPEWTIEAALRLGRSSGTMQLTPTLVEARQPEFGGDFLRYQWLEQNYSLSFREIELTLLYRLDERSQISFGLERGRTEASFDASPLLILGSSPNLTVSLPFDARGERSGVKLGYRYSLDLAFPGR